MSDTVATKSGALSTNETRAEPGIDEREAPSSRAGELVGRYVLEKEIGAGAHGVVYRAFDIGLERAVAIKFLRIQDALHSARARRLLREGQAFAQVRHPNVVAVYDVGTDAGAVFIAMELVDGQTLRDWLAEERSLAEILEVFAQAGRGLAAAHAAGVVHRDFKPDNVLIESGGRAVVGDFGLARSVEDATEGAADGAPTSSLRDTLTVTGSIMGTPAYMAPEQFRGANVDARADQFAFCIALHEALFAVRPFEGESYEELSRAVTTGSRRPMGAAAAVPRARAVPARIRAVLERGLALEPSDRFQDMGALLDALDRRPRRRWAGVTAAVVAVSLGAGAALYRPASKPLCELPSDQAEFWNGEQRAAIGQRLAAAMPGPPGTESARRLEQAVGALQNGWGETWRRVCERTHVTGEQSESLLDLRMECLARTRVRVDALLDRLSEGDEIDERTATRAARVAGAISDPKECETLDADAAPPLPVDPAQRELVRGARDAIEATWVLSDLGSYQQMLAKADSVLERGDELEDPELLASATYLRASALAGLSRYEESEAVLREAAARAAALRNVELTARSWGRLVEIVGTRLHRVDEALALAPIADVASTLAEKTTTRITYLLNVGELHRTKGDFDQAEAAFRKALALGETPRARRAPLNYLGAFYLRRGDFDQAEPVLREALELTRRVDGEFSYSVGTLAYNLAVLYRRSADYDRARELANVAIEVRKAHGSDPMRMGEAYELAGNIERNVGNVEEALVLHRRSAALIEGHAEPQPVRLASVLENIGSDLAFLERDEEAVEVYERALKLMDEAVGPDFPGRIRLLTNVASTYARVGRIREAIALGTEAWTRARTRWGESNRHTIWALGMLSEIQLDHGNPRDAVAICKKLLDAASKGGGDKTSRRFVASAHNSLADAHRLAGSFALAAKELDAAAAVVASDEGATAERASIAFSRAQLRWQRGETSEAIEDVGRLLEAKELQNHPLGRRMRAWLEEVAG